MPTASEGALMVRKIINRNKTTTCGRWFNEWPNRHTGRGNSLAADEEYYVHA